MSADIEVIFHFYDQRPLFNGYRPSHLIDGINLTTGVHRYYETDDLNSQVKGTIEFIAPEHYPNCLQVGGMINMYDGSKKIGYVEILSIFNPILEKQLECRS